MPGVENFLDRYIPNGSGVALDVGANHGVWSAFLAERFESVYAVEANPVLHEALRHLHPRVELLPVGAWSSAERRTFTLFALDGNTSAADDWTGIMAGAPVGSFAADCQPIDEMPIAGRVDFIKVDTEAAEVEVVWGAEQTILRDRPHLIIEVHRAETGEALTQMLEGWGYRLTVVRHPYYAESDAWWLKHYWLVCTPD